MPDFPSLPPVTVASWSAVRVPQKQKGLTVLKVVIDASRDPKDNAYLACADAANCDFLATGDRKGLLYLVEYGTAKIVMEAEFLRILNW